ncbi:hypothetical protein TNCV_5002831 [Trichonephila clavipes]|nr:hypothetical protein TNCV_5002831 [Trichonephila clavipes]
MLCLHDGPFEIVQHAFLCQWSLQNRTTHPFGGGPLVDDASFGLGPAEHHIPMHPGLSGSIAGTTVVEGVLGKPSVIGSSTDEWKVFKSPLAFIYV